MKRTNEADKRTSVLKQWRESLFGFCECNLCLTCYWIDLLGTNICCRHYWQFKIWRNQHTAVDELWLWKLHWTLQCHFIIWICTGVFWIPHYHNFLDCSDNNKWSENFNERPDCRGQILWCGKVNVTLSCTNGQWTVRHCRICLHCCMCKCCHLVPGTAERSVIFARWIQCAFWTNLWFLWPTGVSLNGIHLGQLCHFCT